MSECKGDCARLRLELDAAQRLIAGLQKIDESRQAQVAAMWQQIETLSGLVAEAGKVRIKDGKGTKAEGKTPAFCSIPVSAGASPGGEVGCST